MIDWRELMIGNLLMTPDGVGTVVEILADSALFEVTPRKDQIVRVYDYDNLSPILLTEEIMDCLGERNNHHLPIFSGVWIIGGENGNEYSVFFHKNGRMELFDAFTVVAKPTCFHHLQNLYQVLTGQPLDVTKVVELLKNLTSPSEGDKN